ncbi:SigE family RNA polymerase sigma factor [Cellulomonas sp. DKR-3]|uniref:SigE family RNA polymerase sigma factor n=1 Tax=Cellulomonas fulva TaxID=2835530 RepID=A0ABS5TWV4_9CELL|nr:SigE family RNA polymerase sigma factor [Cellulomonas fulva]
MTKADHDAEFAAFVVADGPSLHRMARLLCGNLDRADELTQAALVKTYIAWRSARRGEPLAYARRVLANARIDTWRSRRREVLTAPESMPEPGRLSRHEFTGDDAMLRSLAELPLQRRRVVVLRYAVGLPELEVAEMLGISVGAVKSAASRGLAQLRHALDTTPDDGSDR